MARTGRIIGPAMAGLAGPEITPLNNINNLILFKIHSNLYEIKNVVLAS